MGFQIYAVVPTYGFRDEVTGHRAFALPNTYVTARGALAIAGRLADVGERDMDDTSYVVVPAGASPFDSRQVVHPVGPALRLDDIPF